LIATPAPDAHVLTAKAGVLPLLQLRGVGRRYDTGGGTVHALQGIDIDVLPGEMLAIMGASGSGKSTLMNVLGCLDVPDSGSYRVAGQATSELGPDELAALRRERFGFIFQRYHLLAHQDAMANVEMPAIYAGLGGAQRRSRATALLQRLGLGERSTHKPNALSGGQQQRVSIARALMNGGEIILADEPTGALDSASGREMMAVLHELHDRGHTVILVTHDAQVAAHAPRVVELSDGRVLRDTGWPADAPRATFSAPAAPATGLWPGLRRRLAQFTDALQMAVDSLRGHRLRSALSMLGISIGIAAVVSIVTLSDAVRVVVDNKLRGMMSNRVILFRGHPNMPPGMVAHPFSPADVAALRGIDGVRDVSADLESDVAARHGNRAGQMSLFGVRPGEVERMGLKLTDGRLLTELDASHQAQFALLDVKARDRLFAPGVPALGQTILLGPLPFTVVGLVKTDGAVGVGDWRDRVFIPVDTFTLKMSGRRDVEKLNLYMREGVDPQPLRAQATQVLKVLHGQEDFNFFSLDDEFKKVEGVTLMLKLVLSAIAGISLLVGGVGVMNIMLVAVSERTPEIGIRMAVGARQGDVQMQFLIEAVVLCAAGGLVGVAISWLAATAVNAAQHDLHMVVSWAALSVAFAVSSAIGIVFGFMPARQASHLSPVRALARE
jgi:macrolide transport system ATP-binding/permease protein